jgi:CBS domain-containing protein
MIVKNVLKAKPSNAVATTSADTSVTDAARHLHERRIGALVVVDPTDAIVGIISERDIARGLALHGDRLGGLRVADLMTSAVLVCSPDDSLESLMGTMTTRRVRHLPVIDKGTLVGMITIGDVVKSRLEEATMQVDQMRDYVMTAR